MSTRFDPEEPARVLVGAWRSGALLDALQPAMRPSTLEEGYLAQDCFFAASSGTRAGWKLGVGSPGQMRSGKLSRPLIGQLDAARLHRDGAALQLPAVGAVTVECEIAFVLAEAVPPRIGRAPVPTDVRHICVSFEIVRSRFVDRRAVGWPSFVADNVGFEALVVGASLEGGTALETIEEVNATALVQLDGESKASALSGEAATDPLLSLSALFAHAAERGITLRAGDIVSTGAMCQPFDVVGRGHTVSARVAGHHLSFTF